MCRWICASDVLTASEQTFSTTQESSRTLFFPFKSSSQSAVTAHSVTSLWSILSAEVRGRSQLKSSSSGASREFTLKDTSAKWISATPGHLMNNDLYTALKLKVVFMWHSLSQCVYVTTHLATKIQYEICHSNYELWAGGSVNSIMININNGKVSYGGSILHYIRG